MAISTINSLFPPYIDSFMPAFNKEGSAKVYFSLSSYNSLEDIKYVHVSLTSQLTNENALKEGQVKIISTSGSDDFGFDPDIGLYYIIIKKTEVINDTWLNNQYYKVQIRFDNNPSGSKPPTDAKDINIWLTEYNKNFSEWSTICLLRPIAKPNLFLRLFDTANSSDENETVTLAFNKGIIPLSGFVQFGDNSSETDTLQSYYIELLKEDTDESVLTTEIVYTSQNMNPNSIEYKFNTQGVDTTDSSKFRIRINCTTRNLYTFYKDYNIELAGYVDYPNFQPNVTASIDNDTGIATISIENGNTVFGTLYIKRASNITGYKIWEDIYVSSVSGSINLNIKDNTVGSMTWYRYSAQLENTVGGMTEIYYSNKICPDFYDAILSRGEIQFTIQFNHKITSFKPVVNRVKIDTLGGKYPKFAENAAMNYKQFQITGTISSQEDMNNLFLKPTDMSEYTNWQVYNDNNRIDEGYDYYWEREFRETLIKWLNDGEPKLYRSQTEGNMAVMLTDISLTPNATLSRRIWDFSATVYEVADGYSLNILDSLGIYKVVKPASAVISGGGGGGDEEEYIVVKKPGQIYMAATDVFDKNDIINNYIAQEIFTQYAGVRAEFDPSNFILSNVKIFFHNKPHLFARTANNNLTLVNPNNIGNYNEENLILGYSFSLSSGTDMRSSFFVDARGFYQIPDNIDVSTLYFPQEDDIVTIEYIITYREYAGSATLIKSQTVERVVLGQETRIFEPNQYVGDYIRRQYLYTTEDYYQKMNWWKGISIETVPNTMVSIHYKDKDNPDIYQIGFSGVLNLIQNFPITTLAFLGRRLVEIPKERLKYAEEWEYVIDENRYSSFEEIKAPKVHTVYHIGELDYIYYIDQEMHTITLDSDGTGIAAVPTNASINYVGDIIRSTLH